MPNAPAGRQRAAGSIRRHRLIETFLVQILHYRWDQVHDDAEHLEHAVSNLMIERLDDLLGYPGRDPHGAPIPRADGKMSRPTTILLSEAPEGSTVVLERISDDDPALLQELADSGCGIGTALTVSPRERFTTSTKLSLNGKDLVLGPGSGFRFRR